MIFFFFTFFFIIMNSKIFIMINMMMVSYNFIVLLSMISMIIMFLIKKFLFVSQHFFNKKIYCSLFILMMLFMNICFFSESIYYFLVFFELSLFPMIFFLMNYASDLDKISSSFFMIILNMVGSLSYIFSSSFLVSNLGSIFFMSYQLSSFCLNSFLMHLSFFMIFLFKLPFLFFHFWLPKAHVSASGSASIVLASLMLKLGSMGLIKLCILFVKNFIFLNLFYSIILCLMFIFLMFYMIRFFDLKYMVAMSSISHMSGLPLMMFSYMNYCYVSTLFLVISHGLISSILFYIVSMFYEQSFNRSLNFFKSFNKISKYMFYIFCMWLLINFSFPPFMSFLSEFFMMVYFYFSSFFFFFFFFFFFIFCNLIFMFFIMKGSINKSSFFIFFDFSVFFIFINMLFFFLLIFMIYIF